jgi:hypothetical protein
LEFERHETILGKAPGPSPWYVRAGRPAPESRRGRLEWAAAGDQPPSNGKMMLRTKEGERLALFSMYCYVLPLPGHRFLVWHHERLQSIVRGSERRVLSFHLIDADRLEPFEDVGRACQEMEEGKIPALVRAGELCWFTIPTHLEGGRRTFEYPEALRDVEEILVLASSPAKIFDLKPKESVLEVFPQDWFNDGPWDFGYQWITRVARDPKTGKIVGDGIRIGRFVLDATNRNVEEWLSGP